MDVVVDGLTFPEAPRWRDGKLWFSDCYTQRVLTVDPRGALETVVEVPQRPSGLGWTPDGAEILFTSTAGQPFGVPVLYSVPPQGGLPRAWPIVPRWSSPGTSRSRPSPTWSTGA